MQSRKHEILWILRNMKLCEDMQIMAEHYATIAGRPYSILTSSWGCYNQSTGRPPPTDHLQRGLWQ